MRVFLKKVIGPWLLLLSFWLPGHKESLFTLPCAPVMMCCLIQSNETNQAWTETFKTVNQNNIFLFLRRLSQLFCYNDQNLTDTHGFHAKLT